MPHTHEWRIERWERRGVSYANVYLKCEGCDRTKAELWKVDGSDKIEKREGCKAYLIPANLRVIVYGKKETTITERWRKAGELPEG